MASKRAEKRQARRRAPHPCASPGCPGLVTVGRYCDRCAGSAPVDYERERGSAAARGYGHRWRKFRRIYLRRHPFCVQCGEMATDVDHIVPRRQGGGDEEDNLQALCHACHSRKTRSEQGGGGIESL